MQHSTVSRHGLFFFVFSTLFNSVLCVFCGRAGRGGGGQVALFKSMAAAADWANGLTITSGSFQVAEVAPAMREAFEKEVCCL